MDDRLCRRFWKVIDSSLTGDMSRKEEGRDELRGKAVMTFHRSWPDMARMYTLGLNVVNEARC